MDVHIGHDRNVGGYFRENSTDISHRQYAMVSIMFVRSTVDGGSVGLVLVLPLQSVS